MSKIYYVILNGIQIASVLHPLTSYQLVNLPDGSHNWTIVV